MPKEIWKDNGKDNQKGIEKRIESVAKNDPTPSKQVSSRSNTNRLYPNKHDRHEEVSDLAGIGSWIEEEEEPKAEDLDQERAKQSPMSRWLRSDATEEPWSAAKGVEKSRKMLFSLKDKRCGNESTKSI